MSTTNRVVMAVSLCSHVHTQHVHTQHVRPHTHTHTHTHKHRAHFRERQNQHIESRKITQAHAIPCRALHTHT